MDIQVSRTLFDLKCRSLWRWDAKTRENMRKSARVPDALKLSKLHFLESLVPKKKIAKKHMRSTKGITLAGKACAIIRW